MNCEVDITGKNLKNNISLKNLEITGFSFVHDTNNITTPNCDPETQIRITGVIYSDVTSIESMAKDFIKSILDFDISSLASFVNDLYSANKSNTKKLFEWSKHYGNDDYYRNLKVSVKLSETNIREYSFEKMRCDSYQESFDTSGNGYFSLGLRQSKFSTENNRLEVSSFDL